MVKKNRIMTLLLAATVLAVFASSFASAATVSIPDGKSRIYSNAAVQWTGDIGSTNINLGDALSWNVQYKNEMGETINAMSNYKFGSMGMVNGHTYAYNINGGSTWTSSSAFTTTTSSQYMYDIYRDHYYWSDSRCAETSYVMQDLY
ncbi:hypothetical protein [Methanocella arvoryzae]|uniref:Uncharacterized protein n=1 Tax=Methanocella arvoryzae (strain DSM 22066 / NBRC 105507 / MRE50) TaxID=351160 RepID=Q0W6S0_METAR|nr:hypothetical protein [Methanocella arvoryzae]CAJ35923.1 hypothetical protein RCIX495 [Methanocella arvoryzae MRE50]